MRGDGIRIVTEGSTNGHYLQDRVDFQFLAKEVAKSDYIERGDYRVTLDKLNAIRAARNTWAWTAGGLQKAVGNPSPWLNETWGPPIKDASGNIVEPPELDDEPDHPSHIGRLSAQYSGRKRHSNGPLPGKPPRKQLKKKHKRYTWPANSEIECVRPDFLDRVNAIEDIKSKHQKRQLIIHPPKPKEPTDRVCTRCGKKCYRQLMLACPQCFRMVYCSLRCREKRDRAFCSQNCEEENSLRSDDQELLHVLDPASYDSSSSTSSGDGAIGEDELSTASDSPRDGASNEGVDRDSTLGVSASEIEEQVKAIEEFERGKRQRELHEQIDDLEIADYRIIHKGRTLQYEIVNTKDSVRRWLDATDLHAPEWTKKMSDFWYNNSDNATTRRFLEDPDGDKGFEPAPFGRFILKAEFSRERDIVFDLRAFERATPEGWEDREYWFTSHELGPEWDDPIRTYWTRCRIAQDWQERKKAIEDMELVSTELRNDSIAEEKENVGWDRYNPSTCEVQRHDAPSPSSHSE